MAEKALTVWNIVKKEPATWFKWIGGVLNVLLFLLIVGSAIFPSISGDKVSLRQIQTSDIVDLIEISFYDAVPATTLQQATEMQDKINKDYLDGMPSDLNASVQSPLIKTKKQYNCLSDLILLKLLTCRKTKLNLNLDL